MNVNIFVTCLADIFYPEVGERLVSLLERLGCSVEFPEGQTCCGQPGLNSGYEDCAQPPALQLVETFAKTEGPIVAPFGSCVHTIKHRYPELLADHRSELAAATEVAERTYDFSSFIVDQLGKKNVGGSFPGPDGAKVVYHDECHLRRGLGVFEQPRQLLGGVERCEIVELDSDELCCGFGGTFSLKLPEVSVAMADEKIDRYVAAGADAIVSTDVGCLMHLEGRVRRRDENIQVYHLLDLLEPGGGL